MTTADTTPDANPFPRTPADTLAEMADTLRVLRILARAARRRATQAARAGQRLVAMRFLAHARRLARAAGLVQVELRRALALPATRRASKRALRMQTATH